MAAPELPRDRAAGPLDGDRSYSATAIEAAVRARQYRSGDIEAIARLILGDIPVKLQRGPWWAFSPERNLLVYPAHLLDSWPAPRAIGALCHELAEVLFAGPDAVRALSDFIDAGRALGLEPPTSLLLLNVVNDFRVNRQYLDLYPGSGRFLRVLYREAPEIHPKDDLRPPRGHLPSHVLAHHRFLEALIHRWAASAFPEMGAPPPVDRVVADALRRAWPAVERAGRDETLAACGRTVAAELLDLYASVVAVSRRELETARDEDEPGREFEPPKSESDDEPDTFADEGAGGARPVGGEGTGPVGGPAGDEAGVFFFVRDDATSDDVDEEKTEIDPAEKVPAEKGPSANGQPAAPATPRMTVAPGPRWAGGVIHRMRRFRVTAGVDYENFDYFAAVHRLEPLIDATVHGRDGLPGLAHILNLRRFGTADPFRRPRRFRRGDSGDIDEDHPERLLIDPALAFLKGARQRREDSLKDFADAIMLDISGSVIQTGYPSKKFDQLVDTAVLFIEIHERLKLPYEIMCFSDEHWVLRSFRDNEYDNVHIEPNSAYVVKDFSYLIRDMYELHHGETQEAPALRQAIADVSAERGLKTVLMVTDGISSDRPALVDALLAIAERNEVVVPREQLAVLAFGLGLAEGEFKASYEPVVDGVRLGCSRGTLVPRIDALPDIICQAIAQRILSEGRLDAA